MLDARIAPMMVAQACARMLAKTNWAFHVNLFKAAWNCCCYVVWTIGGACRQRLRKRLLEIRDGPPRSTGAALLRRSSEDYIQHRLWRALRDECRLSGRGAEGGSRRRHDYDRQRQDADGLCRLVL